MHPILGSILSRNTNMPVYLSGQDAVKTVNRIMEEGDPRALRSERSLKNFFSLLEARSAPRKVEALDLDEIEDAANQAPQAYVPEWMARQGGPDETLDYGMSLKDGIACLNIDEPLSADGHAFCGKWFHGYASIDAALRLALADERVKAIFLRHDSPGGVVHDGLNVLTRTIRAATKPIWTYAQTSCSAAYWIAAQTDRIIAPETGSYLGSIGACIVHIEYANALKKEGVTVTAIESEALKTDGASFKALSDTARAHFTAIVEMAGRQITKAVCEGRPILTPEAVRDFAGRAYGSLDDQNPELSALDLNLCDAIMSEEDAFAALRDTIREAPSASASSPSARGQARTSAMPQPKGKTPMAKPKPASGIAAQKALLLKQQRAIAAKLAAMEEEEEAAAETEEEDLDAEDEEIELDENGDPIDPETEGHEDETEASEEEEDEKLPDSRTAKAILDLPEAKGRAALARQLAFTPGMNVNRAKGLLKAAGKSESLSARMSDPKLSGGQGGVLSDEDALAARALAAHAKATGIRPAGN